MAVELIDLQVVQHKSRAVDVSIRSIETDKFLSTFLNTWRNWRHWGNISTAKARIAKKLPQQSPNEHIDGLEREQVNPAAKSR